MKSIVTYILVVAATVALDQLTRPVEFQQAIGYLVMYWCFVIGAALTLAVIVLGTMTAFHILMEGADRFALESVMKRLKSEARS